MTPHIVHVALSTLLVVCVGIFVWQLQSSFPAGVSRLLTAVGAGARVIDHDQRAAETSGLRDEGHAWRPQTVGTQ